MLEAPQQCSSRQGEVDPARSERSSILHQLTDTILAIMDVRLLDLRYVSAEYPFDRPLCFSFSICVDS